MYELTKEGKKYLKEGLPEIKLIKKLAEKELSFQAAKSLENFNIGFQWAKKNNWIKIDKGFLKLTELGKKVTDKKYIDKESVKEILKKINEAGKKYLDKESVKEILKKINEEKICMLSCRSLVKKVTSVETEMKKLEGKEVLNVTPELLKTGYWKKVNFKKYNVEIPGKKIYPGKKHPLNLIAEKISEIFIEMGFSEMKGPLVETSFWDMDSMFIPQDHPAREMQDTFYLSKEGDLPEKTLIEKIKEVQEHGGNTGSKGWQTEWKPEIAKRLLLRTHTTSVTYRKFAQGIKIPCKHFCIGRVFRNEAADSTHLPEFHQVEGFIAAEGLNLRSLMGFIKEFYSKMGLEKIKFKFTYNPYTEPSLEAFAYSEKHGKWIELINSGIFRPECLAPYGIKVPVIAWGLAVERLAMFVFDKKSIKEVLGHTCDLKDLREGNMLGVEKW
ncbi:MAG: phenylalanine--tRNA ligase subunit alpha [Candidatus Aenigmarchaeota archaeon]|nr:phenylalanine--tRNA ligase subunit alpha [Candidatus Aenigmarchaeota archaeon]